MSVEKQNVEQPVPTIFDELLKIVEDKYKRHEASGKLRAYSGYFFQELSSKRRENIEPLEDDLIFLAGKLKEEIDENHATESSPEYLLGRVHSLIDLAGIVHDFSLSTEVIEQAKKPPVSDILNYLVINKEKRMVELAELEKEIGVDGERLRKVLAWMHENYMTITFFEDSDRSWVELWVKGEAYQEAIKQQNSQA